MRLGIDTGGTFTDAVLYDGATGVVRGAKSLTTHHDLSIGIREVIQRLDECERRPLPDDIEFTAISTTLATNAIVEGHGGTVCLLLIGHNPDALERSGLKSALRGDPVAFISGGHTALGEPAGELDVDAAKKAIRLHADRVSAFAVAGVFSVRNTAHELEIRNLALELADKPVTCSHELSAELDGPRRAMTAVLNARLIAPISDLIRAVREELAERKIDAPLMVVKGDGSMISADIAASRPVETILSGPAASIVGACQLAGKPVKVVSDIGGTTTDIAILRDGRPAIAPEGAIVGGFRTFVEAVDVYTVGLGGDSQVGFGNPPQIGPVRALPICALAKQHPDIVRTLADQLSRKPQEYQGCFAVGRRQPQSELNLDRNELKVWSMLREAPVNCEELYRDLRLFRAFNRLRTRDVAIMAAFTPTDALHVLGEMNRWESEAASLAARLWQRGFMRGRPPAWDTPEEFCQDVIDTVIELSAKSLVRAALASEFPASATGETDALLMDKGVSAEAPESLDVRFRFTGALAAVGAPAEPFYPEIARRLDAELIIPEHADVGNAVGAVAGGISQRVSGLITSPAESVYRTHTPAGIKDFNSLEDAAAHVTAEVESLALSRALESNAIDPAVSSERRDTVVRSMGDTHVFVESRISAVAAADAMTAGESQDLPKRYSMT